MPNTWNWDRTALLLAVAAAASIIVSIAAFNILLGAAIVALLASRQRWQVPPIASPLALFLLWTLLALAFSINPVAGLPQLKKMYVFLVLPVVFTVVRDTRHAQWIFFGWIVGATTEALLSVAQFASKYAAARSLHREFYPYYIAGRITGFTNHWMTLGGKEMAVLLILAALLLFGLRHRGQLWLAVALALLALSLVLSFDRSVWLGALAGGIYLIGRWRPRLLWAVPVLLLVAVLFSPAPLRQRLTSIYRPHGQLDSNSHRYYTLLTGLRMVAAHPWFGLGPEEIGPQFDAYIPPTLPKKKPDGFYGHLHNIYVQYPAERGIPALLFLLWAIALALRDYLRALAMSPAGRSATRFLLHACVAVLLAILVEGLGEHNLGDSEVLVVFLVTLACGYRAVASQQERTE